jgi:inner membrane protein
MAWWLWILLGLLLLVTELATAGGFFALFFGLAALLVGVVTGLGWGGDVWVQWLLFSALAIGALLVLRRPLRAGLLGSRRSRAVDSLVGEAAVLLEDLPAGGVAKAELRGSSWSARTREPAPLTRGQRCRVERVEGLTLWIRPETGPGPETEV